MLTFLNQMQKWNVKLELRTNLRKINYFFFSKIKNSFFSWQ